MGDGEETAGSRVENDMRPTRPTRPTIVLLLTALSTLACRSERSPAPPAAEPRGPEMVLRTYPVPSGTGQEIRSILDNVFAGLEKDKLLARASLSPDGRLVVVGPPGIQDGVKSFLDEVGKAPPPAAPPTVEITYWLVAGRRTQKYAAGPGLKDVEKVLAAVADADGPMEFTLVERLRLTSLSSERGFAQGQTAEVSQQATVTGGTLVADLSVTAKPAIIQTRVQLTPGQTLVLGEAGYQPLPPDVRVTPGEARLTEEARTLYVVLRPVVTNGQPPR